MKTIRNILLITLALLVQSVFFGKFDIYGVRPDLALIVLIFLSNETTAVPLIFYGFLTGFIQDVYSPEYLGYNAFAMSLTAYFLSLLRERLTVENYTVRLLATVIACLLHDAFYLSLYTGFELNVLVSLFVSESLPGAVYTSVLAVFLVKIWQWAKSGGLILVIQELIGSER